MNDMLQAIILVAFVSYNVYTASRLASLESSLQALLLAQASAAPPAPADPAHLSGGSGNASARFVADNIFYAGLSTSVELDYPILGPALQGERDAYATVHPGIISYGAVLVRGSGRLILDGDRSDIVLKIDGMYISMREALALGRGINRAYPPALSGPPALPALPAWLALTCLGTDPNARGSGCAWRQNWGLDACSPYRANTTGVCVCGGGWQRAGGQVVTRHLLYHTPSDADYFLKTLSVECCTPDASATCEAQAWFDRPYQCDMDGARPGTLCDMRDRATYLNAYSNCPCTSVAQCSGTFCRNYARLLVGQTRWGVTRDYAFDDGNWYSIALGPNIWTECPLPRLVMGANVNTGTSARDATWACNTDATRFWIVPAPLRTRDYTNSYLDGGMYYLSTRLPGETDWYCLAPGPKAPQLLFVLPDAVDWSGTACTAFYLGNRTVGQMAPMSGLGFDGATRRVIAADASLFLYQIEPQT